MEVEQAHMSCTQCGGILHPDDEQVFLKCPHCQSTLYLSRGSAVFHRYMSLTMSVDDAHASLRRWMTSNQLPTNLVHTAKIGETSFAYFPIWRIQTSRSGEEELLFELGTATSVTEVKNLTIPGGDLQAYTQEIEDQSVIPSISMDSVINRLAEQGIGREEIADIQLIHLPIFTVKYEYKQVVYTALVEGFTGKVFANLYPQGPNLPLKRIALTVATPFIILGTCPWIGLFLGGREGQSTGLAICLGAGILTCLGLVIYVVRKAEER